MSNWKSFLHADPTCWLLEEDNPSIRYYTLINILDKSHDNPEVIESKNKIMEIGVVPKILSKQEAVGYWGIPENFYLRGKYKGTSWQLIILAEFGVDIKDKRIKKACEFIFKNSQDPESGGFAYMSNEGGTGDHEKVLPCLTANMAWSLTRLGYEDLKNC